MLLHCRKRDKRGRKGREVNRKKFWFATLDWGKGKGEVKERIVERKSNGTKNKRGWERPRELVSLIGHSNKKFRVP